MSRGTITKIGNTAAGLGTVVTQPTLDLLTALGHGNGSGTTEEFTNFPGMPRVLHAANYGDPSDSSETKINAMITAALAAGATSANPYVGFIPASMLGYGVSLTTADSSHVLHNAAVHMAREGGSFSLSEFDAEAYGAKANQDSYAAIQTCLASAGIGRGTVRLSTCVHQSNGYKLSKPLRIVNSGTRLIGPREGVNGGFGVWLEPTYRAGYAIAVMNDVIIPGLGTSLATGSGQSWTCNSVNRWFNLRDCPTMDLNGLTAFTVQAFIKPTAADLAAGGPIFNSQDGFGTTNNAFRFGYSGTSTMRATITTTGSGTVQTSGGAALTADTVYYVEASWDGAMLRWFLGTPGGTATLQASVAATGTMVQGPGEDCCIGNSGGTAPETNLVVGVLSGPISSVHISNIARHTASFTAPTAEHTPDANTLALVNWDEIVGFSTKVYTGATTTGYLFLRSVDGSSPYGVGPGWEISGINIGSPASNTSSGIFIGPNCPNGVMDRIYMKAVRSGIWGPLRDSYMHQFSNVFIDASGGWYGVACNGNNALQIHWDTLIIFGGRILFATGQGGHQFSNCFFQTAAGTEVGVALSVNGSRGTTALNCQIVTEVTPASTYIASLIIYGQAVGNSTATLEWVGGTIAGARSTPPIYATRVATAGFHGTTFSWNGTAAGSITAIDSGHPPLQPMRFDGCHQMSSWVPWSDTAGTAVVGKIGKLSAITYSATPTFACDVRDEFEITLTGDCAPTITNVTPGQSILVTIIQDGAGSHLFTWPANVKGGGTISATAGSVNQQRFTAMLDSATNPTLMADAAMVSV